VGLHHPAVCAALVAQLGHRRLRRPAPAVRHRRAPGRLVHRPEPLHALFPHRPEVASPYSPSSRKALNPIYLDVQTLADLAAARKRCRRCSPSPSRTACAACAKPRWSTIPASPRPRRKCCAAVAALRAARAAHPTARAARTSCASCASASHAGPACAVRGAAGAPVRAGPQRVGLAGLARGIPRPGRRGGARVPPQHESAVQFRFWLQWLARCSSKSVPALRATRGMGMGLYCDLAVGVNGGGAETWVEHVAVRAGHARRRAARSAQRARAGLGPAALEPAAAAAARYQPFIETLRANMRHSGALRLDHVMALMRLFWTGTRGRHLRHLPAGRPAGRAGAGEPPPPVHGDRRGPGQRRARDARGHARGLPAVVPAAAVRTRGGRQLPRAARTGSPRRWPWSARTTCRRCAASGWARTSSCWPGWTCSPTRTRATSGDQPRAGPRAAAAGAAARGLLPPEMPRCSPPRCPTPRPRLVGAVYAYLARTPCWLVGVQLEDVTGAAAAGERARHHRGPLPELAAQAFRHRGRPGSDPRFARWPPCCAPSAAGRRRTSAPASCRRWRPRASLRHLPRAVPQGLHLRRRHRGRALPEGAGHQPPVQLALPARAAGQHARLRHRRPRRAEPRGRRRARTRACARRCAARHGPDPRHRAQPHGRAGGRQRLVARRAGARPASAHAETFDIEWAPAQPEMRGRVLLPVLGDHYGKVLEPARSSCTSTPRAGEFGLRYWDHRFPIDPAPIPTSWPRCPRRRRATTARATATRWSRRCWRRSPACRLARQPDDDQRRARVRDAAVYKRQLARLVGAPRLAGALDRQLRAAPERPAGDPASFDRSTS
jgi:(1->4)-alpha-D-glucan 1-alpha-D-glucosylmutase